MKNKNIIISFLLCVVLLIIPISLGTYYSIYNHDFHHWSYNLSNFYDYKNGFILFNQIFLQYGAGQIIFFDLLSNFISINIVSIGIITNFIFSLNIILIFLILKKNSSLLLSFFVISLILIIHPFAHYPWPDYYSGLCVTLFFYFLLNKDQNNFTIFLQSLFLFLAIFFRTTYLLHIISGVIIFYLIDYFYLKKKLFNKLFLFLLVKILLYFLFLFSNDQLINWFNQGIGVIFVYTYGSSFEYMDLIISYIGDFGWIILKLIKVGLRWFYHIFNIFHVDNLVFLIFLLSTIFFIREIYLKNRNLTSIDQRLLFVSLISLLGFIQGFMIYENFRILNSSVGIFIIGYLYFLSKINLKFFKEKKYYNVIFIIPIFIILKLITSFPNNSTFLPIKIYDDSEYLNSEFKFFSNQKKLSKKVFNYYSEVSDQVCNKNYEITNISPDFAIPYICNTSYKKNISPYWIAKIEKTDPLEYSRILELRLRQNEVLITKDVKKSNKLTLIKKIRSPHDPMPWYGEFLYIYKKK